MYRAVIVAGLIAGAPGVAYPCGNEVHLTGDEAVRTIAKAEAFLERGKYRWAVTTLHAIVFEDGRLAARARDVYALYAIRMKTKRSKLGWTVSHFKARSAANPKDMRLRARLAEAHWAAGQLPEARAILGELVERDLMPDAYAYRTLARLSDGEARRDALLACGVRAKNKSICNA